MALANYVKSCSKNVPGNSLLWLGSSADVDTVTVVADELTLLTMVTSKTFKTFDVDQDTLLRIEEGVGTGHNISYVHAIEAAFSKPSAALRTAMNNLADESPCGMIAIVRDGNGLYWVVGYNEVDKGTRGLKLVQDNTTSGAAPDDADGSKSSIRLETKSGYKALPVKSTSVVAVTGITAGA
jgi:hypothetical protein